MLSDQLKQELVEASLEAREKAYAPYSQFHVGAALLCKDGTVFCGCNIENASYGLTICAERIAIGNAVAAGQREFIALCISTVGGVSPCGACRQFAREFESDLPVIQYDVQSGKIVRETTIAMLLPDSFSL